MYINVLRCKHDHLNLGEFETRFVMQIFRFICPVFVTWPHVGYVLYGGALSSHQKGFSFYQESIINDPSYDPLRQ